MARKLPLPDGAQCVVVAVENVSGSQRLRVQLEQKQNELKAARREVHQLRQHLSQERDRVSGLSQSVAQTKAENRRLKGDLNAKTRECEQSEELVRTLRDYTKSVPELLEKVKLQAADEWATAFEGDLKQALEQVEHLKQELESERKKSVSFDISSLCEVIALVIHDLQEKKEVVENEEAFDDLIFEKYHNLQSLVDGFDFEISQCGATQEKDRELLRIARNLVQSVATGIYHQIELGGVIDKEVARLIIIRDFFQDTKTLAALEERVFGLLENFSSTAFVVPQSFESREGVLALAELVFQKKTNT